MGHLKGKRSLAISGMEVKVFSSNTAAILSLFWDLDNSGLGRCSTMCSEAAVQLSAMQCSAVQCSEVRLPSAVQCQ